MSSFLLSSQNHRRHLEFYIFGFSPQMPDMICVWRSAIFPKKKKEEVRRSTNETVSTCNSGRPAGASLLFDVVTEKPENLPEAAVGHSSHSGSAEILWSLCFGRRGGAEEYCYFCCCAWSENFHQLVCTYYFLALRSIPPSGFVSHQDSC